MWAGLTLRAIARGTSVRRTILYVVVITNMLSQVIFASEAIVATVPGELVTTSYGTQVGTEY